MSQITQIDFFDADKRRCTRIILNYTYFFQYKTEAGIQNATHRLVYRIDDEGILHIVQCKTHYHK